MAAWMAYATLVGALLVTAAWAVERGLRLHRVPTRFGWALAILAAVALPAGALVAPGLLRAGLPASLGAKGPAAAVVLALEGLEGSASGSAPGLTVALTAGWSLTTLVLLARRVTAWLDLDSRLTRAARRRVGRAHLYLTSELGPAVTVLRGARLVVPAWVRSLSPRHRRLILRHEREHLEAGDPWLLAGADLLVALVPWNLPLWWGLRRLRLAVETDCDRRVLRTGVDPGIYADLLLSVGERSGPVVGLAALAERTPSLERRIDELTRPASAHRGPKSLLAGVVAAAAVAVACESPTPGQDGAGPTGAAASPAVQADVAADEPPFTPHDVEPRLANVDEVRSALKEAYPDDLEDGGIEGRVVLWLHVDGDGSVGETRVRTSSGVRELDDAARTVARSMEFEPALIGGSPTETWIQQPIRFRSSR